MIIIVIFELVVTKANSWNGKFSGANKTYARAIPDKEVPKNVINKDFTYVFPDGWTTMISVRKMKNNEAKKIISKSVGFMGHDWMIESILKNNEIINPYK